MSVIFSCLQDIFCRMVRPFFTFHGVILSRTDVVAYIAIFIVQLLPFPFQFSVNEGWNPINKNLWSLSFVLMAGGLGFLMLALLYYIVDVRGWWWGSPLREAGMNSITLYVGHQVG